MAGTDTKPRRRGAAAKPKTTPVVADIFKGRKCSGCGDNCTQYVYGMAACKDCGAFLERTTKELLTYNCHFQGCCDITPKRKDACSFCRLVRCFRGELWFTLFAGWWSHRKDSLVQTWLTKMLAIHSVVTKGQRFQGGRPIVLKPRHRSEMQSTPASGRVRAGWLNPSTSRGEPSIANLDTLPSKRGYTGVYVYKRRVVENPSKKYKRLGMRGCRMVSPFTLSPKRFFDDDELSEWSDSDVDVVGVDDTDTLTAAARMQPESDTEDVLQNDELSDLAEVTQKTPQPAGSPSAADGDTDDPPQPEEERNITMIADDIQQDDEEEEVPVLPYKGGVSYEDDAMDVRDQAIVARWLGRQDTGTYHGAPFSLDICD
ncbi:uncharacterized protein LOC124171193 [Ischnura elegans]|uniref:uncharacterized protein LOC124171193 n=1 Tax=Ischnura elegans TaxID=197161 RepID=UPI001ED8994B|nr:uncharacterized protein LOC124171193 [Ischnura elegans]